MKLRDELAEKYEKEIEDAISAYLKIDENREPLRYTDDLDIDFAAGFDACEARYLPIIEKLEGALKTNIPYIDSIWNLTKQVEIENMCRKQKHFSQQALAELAEFKKKMNGE